jgi:cell division protein FtsL
MILLVLISILLILLYVRIDANKIKKLSKQIKAESIQSKNGFDSELSELSSRQKEVYDLIVSGKTKQRDHGLSIC